MLKDIISILPLEVSRMHDQKPFFKHILHILSILTFLLIPLSLYAFDVRSHISHIKTSLYAFKARVTQRIKGKRRKESYNYLPTALTTSNNTTCVVVKVPQNVQPAIISLQETIQQMVTDLALFSLMPPYNLYIVLQDLGTISTPENMQKLHDTLEEVAERHTPFDLTKSFNYSTICIDTDGQVHIVLKRSTPLTTLAEDIRITCFNKGISLEPRCDFPDYAHITIGSIAQDKIATVQRKLAKLKITVTTKSFFIEHFTVIKLSMPDTKNAHSLLSFYEL